MAQRRRVNLLVTELPMDRSVRDGVRRIVNTQLDAARTRDGGQRDTREGASQLGSRARR